MTLELLVPLLGLALLDSLNPSALVAMLVLLSQPRPLLRGAVYMLGVFVTYFGLGVALMLGLRAFLDAASGALESSLAHAAQGVLGAGMLLYSFTPGLFGRRPTREVSVPDTSLNARAYAAPFLLGATVTVLELVTAFPYLAAILLLTQAGLPVLGWLPLLLGYNLIFVLPPFGLLLLHRTLERRWPNLRERLHKEGQETVLWIVGIVGFLLLRDSLGHFDYFGLLQDRF